MNVMQTKFVKNVINKPTNDRDEKNEIKIWIISGICGFANRMP